MKTDHRNANQQTSFLCGFVEHPASVNQTYLQHAQFAGKCSLLLFQAGFAALVHAIIPPLCEKTASKTIERLHTQIQARHQGL